MQQTDQIVYANNDGLPCLDVTQQASASLTDGLGVKAELPRKDKKQALAIILAGEPSVDGLSTFLISLEGGGSRDASLPFDDTQEEEPSIEEQVIDKMCLEDALSSLTLLDRAILLRVACGYTFRQIQAELASCHVFIRKRWRNIQDILRKCYVYRYTK